MNKEQLIQQLKYTKEKHKNDKLLTFDTDISAMCSDVLDVLSRCVEIPDNATNGDVLKIMFPDVNMAYRCWFPDSTLRFKDTDWWNAPYRKGDTNEKQVRYL